MVCYNNVETRSVIKEDLIMGYVILQLAVSLDGYIARKDGSVDFLDGMESTFSSEFNEFVNRVDTIIMGRTTYGVMLGFGEIPFKGKKIYVLTSKELTSSDKNIVFSNETIESIVKNEEGIVWLFGGSKVIQSFMNKNLIDEFQLHVVPNIVGEGIPLFLESKEIENLTLTSSKQYGNSIHLIYKNQKR